MKIIILSLLLAATVPTHAQAPKEIALTFDDAPMPDSKYFTSQQRTQTLIESLKELKVDQVMIFANPCKGEAHTQTIKQLKQYKDAGHLLANHTCTHKRLDDVGFEAFAQDTLKADELLKSLLSGQKFFRFPTFNEGTDLKVRDQVRTWLKEHGYRNGVATIDNDDYLFSFKMNKARAQGKAIDLEKLKSLFVSHILGAVEYYDSLSIKTFGSRPKHVILLHEMDATVLFLPDLVAKLRAAGWKIISSVEAYKDSIYEQLPANTYANNGFTAQAALEKTGEKMKFEDGVAAALDKLLGL